ncbi:MAG TPA: DUF3829 domain-containing protein, partial [Kofleriaceae bacterium]|nr:DUF3829 domain-containing protein [Kofleriaceae bacterium]
AGPAAPRAAARAAAPARAFPVGERSSAQFRRASGTTTSARGPRLSIGKALVALVVLGVLGAGGVAGYRYATRGYLLEPPAAPPLQIQVITAPAEAELRVDGVVAPGRSLALAPGASARIRALAPGRMAREILVTAEGTSMAPVLIALPHRLGRSSPHLAAYRDDLPGTAVGAGDAETDDALAKLDQYVECLIPIAGVLTTARDEYRRVTRGSASKIKRNNVPVLWPFPLETVSLCRDNLEAAARAPPRDPSIDQPAASLMETLDEVNAMLEDLGGYYKQERYFNDDLKYGRKRHGALLHALDDAWAGLQPLAAAVAERRAYWQRVELDSVARSEGEAGHWHLRRLAMTVQLWQGAVAGRRGAAPRASELRAAFEQAIEYARAHPAELEEIEGAGAYLTCVEELVLPLIAIGTQVSVTEAFQDGDPCIAAFNALVL